MHIPFANRVNREICLRHWPTVDVAGFILVWHDVLDREPSWWWSPPSEFADGTGCYSPLRHFGGIRRVLPQQALENGPDALHFPSVHGAGEPGNHVAWIENGPFLRMDLELKFGVGIERSWLTPSGPAVSFIRGEASGVGLAVLSFEIEDVKVAQLVSVTPVDSDHSMVFSPRQDGLRPTRLSRRRRASKA